jgi:hypothetical protein
MSATMLVSDSNHNIPPGVLPCACKCERKDTAPIAAAVPDPSDDGTHTHSTLLSQRRTCA